MRRKKLPKNIRRHGAGFRAVVEADGRRFQSPTLPSVERAVAWRDAFKASERQEPSLPPLTLAQGLRLILDDLDATAARDATREFYVNHARILFAGLGGDATSVATITRAMLAAYIERRRRDGVAASTIVGKELFVLRRIRKLAIAAGYSLPTDPFLGLRTPKVRTERFAYLTKERIAELVAAMRAAKQPRAAWHADIVEAIFATGLRLSEFSRLRPGDVDFETGTLSVDGKTGHRRQTFGPALEPALRRLVAACGDGGTLASHRTIEKLFPTWQRRLGEPRFSAHVLRHSFATAMAEKVEPFDLMGLMDHKDLRQTSRYFHARGDAHRAALDSLRLDPPPQAPSGDAGREDQSIEPPSTPRARGDRRARSDD